MSSLPAVPVPLSFLPTFNFLQRLRIVYFHRLLIKNSNNGSTALRIIAVTSSGDMGLFHIDGSRRGTLSLMNELEAVSFNNRYVMLDVANGSDVEDFGSGTLTLDFDTSSALVRGNETTDAAIKRFLHICSHFSRGISIQRAGTLEQQRAESARNFKALVDRSGGDGDDGNNNNNNRMYNSGEVPASAASSPAQSPSMKDRNGYSLRRKSAGSTFQKLFSGFSGVWSKDGTGSNSSGNRSRGNSGNSQAAGGGGRGNNNSNRNFHSSSGEDNDDSYTNFNNSDRNNNNNANNALYDQDEDPNATVSVQYHQKQRKRLNRWREEILSRMGEREGVDAKERILDDLARLEGSLKKQQALIESPPPPSDDEELMQQQALAKLVMFICRRQSMLIEAKSTVIPQIRPKLATKENHQVPTSVPVLPSYLDAFRSQFLG